MSYQRLPEAYICRDPSIYPRPFITRRARVSVQNQLKTDEKGNIVFDNVKLTKVATPTEHTDAVNKQYVDNVVQQNIGTVSVNTCIQQLNIAKQQIKDFHNIIHEQLKKVHSLTGLVKQIRSQVSSEITTRLQNLSQVSVQSYHSITPQPHNTTAYTLSNGLNYVKFIFDCHLLDVYVELTHVTNKVIIKLNDKQIVLDSKPISIVKGDKLSFHLLTDEIINVQKQNCPIFVHIIYRLKLNFYDSTIEDVN